MPLHHKVAQVALTDAYAEINRFVTTLEETDLMRPSGCAGWLVGDVLFHVLTDAHSLLVALSGPVNDPPSVDYLTYWRNYATVRSPETDMEQARYVRIGASAYARPSALVAHWLEASNAVLKVVEYAPGARSVPFLGHVIAITDMFAVAAVEATIHHLDMLARLQGKPIPRPGALELTVRTLDGLLGGIERPEWDDQTFILKATGRTPVTIPERRYFDSRGIQLPLIG